MKYLFAAFLMIFAGAFAQEPDEVCKSCEYGVGVFYSHLRSERAKHFQTATLHRQVCPQFEQPQRCDHAVGEYWDGINSIIYNEKAVPYVCSGLSGLNCTDVSSQINREFNCVTCMRDVALLAEFHSYPAVIKAIETYLKGDGYCENEILGLNEQQVHQCQEFTGHFMGPALRALDGAYTSNAQFICHDWYDGVCPEPARKGF